MKPAVCLAIISMSRSGSISPFAQGLTDAARRLVRCRLTQDTRVENALGDLTGTRVAGIAGVAWRGVAWQAMRRFKS